MSATVTSSFAAKIDARAVSLGVAAASALAGVFFQALSKLEPQPPSLSASWKAEEKIRGLACPRVASEKPVVLNPFKNAVV